MTQKEIEDILKKSQDDKYKYQIGSFLFRDLSFIEEGYQYIIKSIRVGLNDRIAKNTFIEPHKLRMFKFEKNSSAPMGIKMLRRIEIDDEGKIYFYDYMNK